MNVGTENKLEWKPLKLKSFNGLDSIPKEIKEKSAVEILQYAIDLTPWIPFKEEKNTTEKNLPMQSCFPLKFPLD